MRWLAMLAETDLLPVQSGVVPRGTMVEVFEEIYLVFLVLGTLVGVVVIGYMCYLAYKYRDDGTGDEGEEADEADRPTLGELPAGSGGGRKLFTSLTLSAIIVISLIAWTYGTLLFVEGAPAEGSEDFEVQVTGYQFGWEFEYPNGYTANGELRVPQGERIDLTVTSRDVWHNFGIPRFKVKSDAIPGQTTESWFVGSEVGTFQAVCYELCGAGHSQMNADVIVMEPEKFEQWYANTSASGNASGAGNATGSGANATANSTSGTNATNATAGNGTGNALIADTASRLA
jgi:cytochrome c oxidase subunit 2